MSYGIDKYGSQGAQLYYDVWDPKLGTDPITSHQILPNTTKTDIFCGGGSLIGPTGTPNLTGELLITGGDLTVSGQRNYANNNVEVFSPKTNTLTALGTMNFPRWYASHTTLRNGNKLVLGGLFSWNGLTPLPMEPTPEIFHPATGTWRKLPGISTTDPDGDWCYPKGSSVSMARYIFFIL